jgi:hypothetical protein
VTQRFDCSHVMRSHRCKGKKRKRKYNNSKLENTYAFNVMHQSMWKEHFYPVHEDSDVWFVDFRCMRHMIADQSIFFTYTSITSHIPV